MTAAEMIDQIKTLDPKERAKVLDHLLAMESIQPNGCMDDEKFDRVTENVLERHADLLRKLAQ